MPLEIKTRPRVGLARMQTIVAQLAANERVASAESMDALLRSAFALRHKAHLQRAFAPWVSALEEGERRVVRALLRKLTIESAEEANAFIDDHGGYRGQLEYALVGSARTVGLSHFYGHNHSEMRTTSALTLEDRGPAKAGAKAPKTLASERLYFESPTDLVPAAEMLFAYLGPAELSAQTRLRFLLRLLFPWGRYLHGYEGADAAFYAQADRLYALSRARRAKELRAREDDGEVIPFFLG